MEERKKKLKEKEKKKKEIKKEEKRKKKERKRERKRRKKEERKLKLAGRDHLGEGIVYSVVEVGVIDGLSGSCCLSLIIPSIKYTV